MHAYGPGNIEGADPIPIRRLCPESFPDCDDEWQVLSLRHVPESLERRFAHLPIVVLNGPFGEFPGEWQITLILEPRKPCKTIVQFTEGCLNLIWQSVPVFPLRDRFQIVGCSVLLAQFFLITEVFSEGYMKLFPAVFAQVRK